MNDKRHFYYPNLSIPSHTHTHTHTPKDSIVTTPHTYTQPSRVMPTHQTHVSILMSVHSPPAHPLETHAHTHTHTHTTQKLSHSPSLMASRHTHEHTQSQKSLIPQPIQSTARQRHTHQERRTRKEGHVRWMVRSAETKNGGTMCRMSCQHMEGALRTERSRRAHSFSHRTHTNQTPTKR